MPTLFLHREALILGSDRELRRRCQRGELHRIRPGVYLPAEHWQALGHDDRYRMIVRAAAAVHPPTTQFSHDSAAALWRLPTLGAWSSSAHVRIEPRAGGVTRVGMRCHSLGRDPQPVEIDGVSVTSLPRTLLDAAAQPSFARAVTMLDAGIRPPERDDFLHSLGVTPPNREELLDLHHGLQSFAGARVTRAIEFADGLSGSPGESLFRCQCHALGLPAPQLQVPFYDEEGLIGYADTYWEHLDLIAEIDGDIKYSARRRFQLNLTPEQILIAEKRREDRMRRVVSGFVRPPMAIIRDRHRLARLLARHGLVPGSV